MGYPQDAHTGNNSTVDFPFTFPYLKEADIKVSIDGTDKTLTTDYTLHNATTIRFNSAPDTGERIRIYRDTGSDKLSATFYPGSAIRSGDLNDNYTQNLYVTQEGEYDAADAKDYAIRFCIDGDGSNTSGTEKDADISVRPPKPKGVPYAVTQSESAVTTAGNADNKSDTAINTANAASNKVTTYVHDGTNPAGDGVGSNPKGVAYAINTADSADSTATTASNNASNAVTTADAASTKATSALDNSRRSDGSGGWASAIDVADAADTKATTASNNASSAVTTANAATATANSASSTASTASTNATNAKLASDRVVATTSDGGSTWTLSGNNTNASTDPKGVGYAVTTAETASTNATTALDNSREADGSGGWNKAIDVANNATTTANSATSTANTASTNASNAVTTANAASATATAAQNAVAGAVLYTPYAAVSNIPKNSVSSITVTAGGSGYTSTPTVAITNTTGSTGSGAQATATVTDGAVSSISVTVAGNNYDNGATVAISGGGGSSATATAVLGPINEDRAEVADSTGIESFTPLSGMPAGFTGDDELVVKLQYTTSGNTWQWKSYYASDPEVRYRKKLIIENKTLIDENYTIGTNNNAFSVGPVTISSGKVITIPQNSVYYVG